MEVGIGLPSVIPGTVRSQLLEWARRAEQAGFSSLATIDRLVYPNYEPLVALAGAAGVTERIRLVTDILLVPYRANAALLAKQAASLNALAEGRLLLGLGVGGREDDYAASHVDFRVRGRLMDEMLAEMEAVWDGEAIGPPGKPDVIVGGNSPPTFRRAARYGIGWTMGGGTPDQLKEGKARMEAAWEEAGREGRPSIKALAYYGLGPRAEEQAREELGHYYAWLGEYAEPIIAGAATDPDTLKSYIQGFEEAGADEVLLFPTAPDAEQVDLLAEVAL